MKRKERREIEELLQSADDRHEPGYASRLVERHRPLWVPRV